MTVQAGASEASENQIGCWALQNLGGFNIAPQIHFMVYLTYK